MRPVINNSYSYVHLILFIYVHKQMKKVELKHSPIKACDVWPQKLTQPTSLNLIFKHAYFTLNALYNLTFLDRNETQSKHKVVV